MVEVKILRCDNVNKNHNLYPLKEVRKSVKEFNAISKDDSLRNVYYYREKPRPDFVLGKITKLKIKDKILYGEFKFSDDENAQQIKKFYEECINKGVDTSNFDYRIIMDSMANTEPKEDYNIVKDIEIYMFIFGLDSCWR